MAGKGKSLIGKLFGAIKGMLRKVQSFMNDLDIDDIQISAEDGVFKSVFKLKSTEYTTNNGKPLQMVVGVAAKNVNDSETFKTCIDGLTAAENAKAFDGNNANIVNAIQSLLGIDLTPETSNTSDVEEPDVDEVADDIDNTFGENYDASSNISEDLQSILGADTDTERLSVESAQPDSLLAPIVVTNPLPKVWQSLMQDQVLYDLRCECPGYPAGWVTDKSLPQILTMLAMFPARCGARSSYVNSLQMEGEYESGEQFTVNPTNLVMPIVLTIQEYLKEYFESVCAEIYGNDNKESNNSGDKSVEEAVADAVKNQFNPEEQASTGTPSSMTEADNGGTNVKESKKINITLQKINGSSEVKLKAIKANFNPGEALDAVDIVLSNPDFLQLVTETPQSYEVCVDEDDLDVNPCTDLIVEPNENLTQLFIQANQFSRNLHMIHWLSIGNDMEKLHLKAEELYGELDEEIDLLAELIVEKTGTIIDINKIETWNTVGTQNRTFQQGIECIKQDAQSFIDYIDITYPNQPSDVQSILDDWLRYWNKQINYFIVREQEV